MSMSPGPMRGASDANCLSGGGTMGKFMRERDWHATALGRVEEWPQSLRTSVSILLESKFPMYIAWGEEYIQFYNDGYLPILGSTKHPKALGISSRETFSEIWPVIGPMFEEVRRGMAFGYEDFLMSLDRHGYLEECYFTFSYSPIRDETSQVGGIMVTTAETTARVIGERRLAMLGELAALASQARSETEVWTEAGNILRRNPADVAFCLLYRSSGAQSFVLEQLCGIDEASAAAPTLLNLENAPPEDQLWPFSECVLHRRPALVADVRQRFGAIVGPKWPDPVECALMLPVGKPGAESLYGVFIAGISPRRALDDPYRSFLSLVADHLATAIGNVRAYEEERRRVESLAQLDRAKTEFFSNVSHEFRTPLTLMLGPIEETLKDSDRLPPEHRDHLAAAHRNSLRLLKLVNSLLDFSRLEAGRIKATYAPVDLASLTADLCSNFQAAMDAAGLRFSVDCPPVGDHVYVDREMWEKIVLNLVSNAFKFTLEGEIAVSLRTANGAVELRVRDTGAGVPAEEIPRLFERFHRVPNVQGRTHEGSGIGLALVQELVKLHGGTVRAESRLGEGSTFIVHVPLGKAHLPPEHIGAPRAPAPSALGVAAVVEEALRWLPDHATAEDADFPPTGELLPLPEPGISSVGSRPRLLVADDNADMRQYLARVLAERYDVQTVPDGKSALDAARGRRPDLILSDIMMPRLDGAGLMRELRANADLKTIPVIFLSARAGEEARVEGFQHGADDYLTKPFSARELLARVAAHLELARLRKQSEEAIRRSEARYRSLFEHMLDGFAYCRMLYDERGHPDDFVYLAVNDAFGRLTGLKDVVGKRVTEAIPGIKQLQPELFEIYGRVASSGTPERFEIDFRPLGLCLSISVYSPERGYFVAVFDNITERKQAETALRESEERFRALVTASSDAVYRMNRDWTEMRQMVGREFVADTRQPSRNWLERYLLPEDEPRMLAAIDQAVRTSGVFELEHRIRRADGSLGWAHSRAVPILNDAGEIAEWFGTASDITARKLADERLRQAQKLEGIGLLAGGIAHDFNNLLVGVIGNASLVQEMLPPGDPAAEMVETIAKTGEQLAHLTRQMLAYAGKGRFLLEPLSLSNVARDIGDLLRPSIPKKVALRFELDEDAPPIEADRGQVQQVLMNLVINAAEAIGQHDGAITVTTGTRTVDAEFTRTYSEASDLLHGEYVALEVRDSGCGMDESVKTRIFDPFYSTKFTGRGLGLAAVHGIVRGHSGAILVSSEPGKGSVFTVLFPASARNAEEVPTGSPQKVAKGSGTVLIIDDEEVVRGTAKGALERHGYDVLVAQDGPAAIDIFRRHPGSIHVAVLDLSMPGMSGEETLPELRKIRPDVKVLVSSGYNESETMAMFTGQRVSGFLQKPYTAATLLEKVASILGPERLSRAPDATSAGRR